MSSGADKGITVLEVLVSLIIFTVIIVSTLVIFKHSLLTGRKSVQEKDIYSEAVNTLDFLSRHLSLAMANELTGECRIDFLGSRNWVRFVAPFSEGEGSDLCKFGVYHQDDKIKVQVLRVDKARPDFLFPSGFPGAQVLGENVGELQFYYRDGTAWCREWDSRPGREQAGRLPEIIRIEILVVSPEKVEGKVREKRFTRLVRLGT